jgi:hypothetical protein
MGLLIMLAMAAAVMERLKLSINGQNGGAKHVFDSSEGEPGSSHSDPEDGDHQHSHDATVSIEFENKKRIEPDHIFPHNGCHLKQALL